MKRNIMPLIVIAILSVGLIGMLVLSSMREEPKKQTPPPRIKVVNSIVTRSENNPTVIEAFGRLTSTQPIALISEVNGTIERGKISFQPAQSFSKGDLIVKIDDRQTKFQLNQTKSDFLSALAAVLPEIKIDFPDEFDKWQNYFNSISFDEEITELPKVSNQKIKLFLTRFNVYKLYFTIKNLEITLDKHYFYAPFSGSIQNAELREGSTVRAGSKLGDIINLEDMEVEISLPVTDVKWIDYSKQVKITSNQIAGIWDGKIKRISDVIDNQNQTVTAYISILNRKGLFNGIFLKAEIPGKSLNNSFSIPRKSIYSDEYVYLIKNGKLDYRKVEIARKETERVIVSDGINSGDTLVTELMQGVSSGMLAKPIL